MDISITYGLASMLGFGMLNAFIARYSKPFSTLRWGFAIQFIALIFLILFAVTTERNLLSFNLFQMIIPGIFGAIAYLAIVRAFQTELASLVAPTISLWAIITTLLSVVFLGENLTILKGIGIVTALGGLVLLSIDFKELDSKGLKDILAGLRYALYAALLLGFAFFFLAQASQGNDWVAPNTYMRLWSVVTLFAIIVFKSKNPLKDLTPPPVSIGIGFFDMLVMAVFNIGLSVGLAGVVSTISSLNPLVTTSIGLLFLKEKLNKRQLGGIIITVLGIIILSI